MEILKNITLEEEPIIYNPRIISNFGVHSEKVKSPKNLFMSFTPTSQREISFPNTIMYPIITTEATNDSDKNINNCENEKSKYSIKKESTRIKTDESKEEKNNISYEKQIFKTLNESNEINNTNENGNINLKENKLSKNSLETNPFFMGCKSSIGMNKFINKNDISEVEEKKVNKILNKDIANKVNEDSNLFYKSSKNLYIETPKNKIIRKTNKMKTLNLAKSQRISSLEKEQNKIKRKNKIKHKTFLQFENILFTRYNSHVDKKESKNNNDIKKNFTISRKCKREQTVLNKSPMFKLKDNNIKMYRASIFNMRSSAKIRSKLKTHIIREYNQENEDEEKNKKKKLQYIGKSDTSLNNVLNLDTPTKKKKKEKLIEAKKPSIINNQLKLNHIELGKDLNIKTRQRSQTIYQMKRMISFSKENEPVEKKKSQFNKLKKINEAKKHLDFELALKNKNNLANTQYNLFSPDKFTNTQFCGSDYCEYTLQCMDIILNENKSQKQTKNKVNFNFPKPQKNKPKKKIALFDLDETLVHCTGEINLNKEQYQHSIDINLPGNKTVTVGINIRPYWKKTLNLIKRYYHIVVFTASHQAYADAVLDFMDPNKKYFKYRLYRNNCSLVENDENKFYVKDLDIFDEYYDLKDIVIIDNSVLSFIYHLENGIPIVPYYNEDKDGSLYVVGLYLRHIYKENDLREANKKYINLDSFLKEARERKDLNSTINEESISIENNTNINNTEKCNNPRNSSSIKLELNKVNLTSNDKDNKTISSKRTSYQCLSLQNDKGHQNKLISQSKLINMYYSINDKCISTFGDKNKNNITTDEEKDINENDSNKDDSDLFLKKRLLTNEIKRTKSKITFKKSNKTCREYLDLKLVCSNFNNNFFSDKII